MKTYSPVIHLRNSERPFQGRDVTALQYLAPCLIKAGFCPADPTLLSPQKHSANGLHGCGIHDFPSASRADLLVMMTRPSLDDDVYDKRSIPRSQTWLEEQILAGIRDIFRWCNRHQVIISEPLLNRLRADIRVRGNQRFRTFVNRRIDRMSEYLIGDTKHIQDNVTAGYVGYLPRVPGVERPFLCIFGMSGDDTLRTAWVVANHSACAGLLHSMINHPASSPRLMMIEIEKSDRKFDPLQPLDTSFRRVEVLFDVH